MDGYETASLIREREQTARIPIIFLSAVNKETEHLMRGYAMGAVDYVFKPVDPLILKSKVGVFVDLYNMRVAGRGDEPRRAGAARREFPGRARTAADRARTAGKPRARGGDHPIAADAALHGAAASAEPRQPPISSAATVGDDRLHASTRSQADPYSVGADGCIPTIATGCWLRFAERQSTGRFSIEYRWQCADGGYKHFLDQARAGEGCAMTAPPSSPAR